MSVQGRNALVTGGGRGIGAATAFALAAAGARVGVAARTVSEIDTVAERIRAGGREAFAFRCDIGEPDDVDAMVRSATASMGPIDILVNNAGGAVSNPIRRTTLDEWNHMMAINATGAFLCTRAVLGGMAERGWGRIVNVASIAGLEGARYVAAYVASKHAVVGFTRAAAKELSGTGVTINAVCPGWVNTPMTGAAIERVIDKTGLPAAAALASILDESGQGALIEPEEVAARIVELCGDDAADVSGEAIVIDGKGGSP